MPDDTMLAVQGARILPDGRAPSAGVPAHPL